MRDPERPQHGLIKCNGARGAALTSTRRVRFLRVPAQEPELRVLEVLSQRIVYGLPVGQQLRHVFRRIHGGHLLSPDFDPPPLARADVRGKRFCPLQESPGARGVVEARVDAAQSDVGHCQGWIETQRLVERPRCLDPDVGLEIVEALVVEGLSILGCRRHRFVRVADSGA
jgi:hypothetical protein